MENKYEKIWQNIYNGRNMMIKFALKTMITEFLIVLLKKHIYSMIQVQRNKYKYMFLVQEYI